MSQYGEIDDILNNKYPFARCVYLVKTLDWNCQCAECGTLLSVENVVVGSSTTIHAGQCVNCTCITWVLSKG